MATEWNKAEFKIGVLTDNIAQGVHKYLNELESNRESMHTRWIWELLQNARDASMGKDRLIATVQCLPNELTFLHNGKGFTEREIAHLILHGSTKVENERAIGRYGTGFLTTHLLSPKIDVSGQLNTGKWFNFCLERKPDSVEALDKAMNRAWEDFDPSSSLRVPIPADFTTRFVYPIGSNAVDAVEKGTAMLKQCAPFVVVFNQEFSRIDIKNRGETTCFEVVERLPLDSDGIRQITVAERTSEGCMERKYLLAQRDETSVAIPLESSSDGSVCLPIGNTPRLFLGFPLVGTEDFSFPAVINSFKFTPTENRDGVYLGQGDNDENVKNQEAIEEACELLIRLLGLAASSHWRNAHLLTEVPAIPGKDWLNQEWLRTRVTESLIEEICQTPAVLNEAGDAVAPKKALLPLAQRDTSVTALWDLLDGGQRNREKMPRRREALGWCNAVGSWARLSEDEPSVFAEAAVEGDKLASRISNECSSLPDLQNWLQEDVCAVEWLNRLYGFLRKNGFERVIRDRRFVPNQVGEFHQLSNLRRDKDIDEELKDIGELLEWRIRRKLRDTRLPSLARETGEGDWDGEYVVEELIKKLQARARKNPDENFKEASARLFAWIVGTEAWDRLQGFPVFAEDGNSGNFSCIFLPSTVQDSAPPLAPVSSWPKDLEMFSDLFPPSRIVADAFFEVLPNPDTWRMLNEQNLVRMDMIITRTEKVNFKDFSPEEDLEDKDHKAVDPITVTDIVKRVEIMERVSDSRPRAHLFWQFLTEQIIREANQGLEFKDALCECGVNHKYSPAAWLMPVRNNKWIREKDKRSRANAQSLASLLREREWDPSSLNQNPAVVKLLKAIGVSEFDLMRGFVTESDEERNAQDSVFTEILVASGDNFSRIPKLVQYMADDEDLFQHLEERRKERRVISNNQRLGQHVEKLVKKALEQLGFSVERTGTGSDFEISDLGTLSLTQDNQSWLIEVKSTRTQSVQISSEQSKTAVEKGEEFLLCIVPIESGEVQPDLENVRTNMRFLKNPGAHLVKPWKELNFLEEWRTEIANESLPSGIKLVVEKGATKIHVASSVWESEGFSLEDLAENLWKND